MASRDLPKTRWLYSFRSWFKRHKAEGKNNMLNEQNRAEFLQTIAQKLGREVTHTPKPQDPLLII